jgi:acetylornithine aminotransferase
MSVAAALAVLEVIDRDGLVDHVAAVGKSLAAGIESLDHPLIDHVRGAGLLLGVVLRADIAKAVEAAARDAGFLINAPAADVLRLAPPLILTEEQGQTFVDALPGLLDTAQDAEKGGES